MNRIINLALKEDIGRGDITTNTLIPLKARSHAYIITREKAVICGLEVAKRVFKKLDPSIKFRTLCKDGNLVPKNAKIMLIQGKTRAILTGERVALNFLSHLSAIATKTRLYAQKARPYNVKIFDTRKTTPGLRILEKYAVRCGGGVNHRLNLSEMILIKDNHREKLKFSSEKPLSQLVKYAKKTTRKPVEIEVDNFKHFREVLKSSPDFVLLDNMSIKQIRNAVRMRNQMGLKKTIKLEVSGNVDLKKVAAIARTGIDRISSGSLTHTKKAVDVSLELIS